MKAVWNDVVIAESDDIVTIEHNAYFPASAVDPACLRPSARTSLCSWKGEARYYSIEAGGKVNEDAAWFYPEPKDAAAAILGRIAFW